MKGKSLRVPFCEELDAKIQGLLMAGALSRDDLDSLIAALEQRCGADLRRQLRRFIERKGGGTPGFDEDDAVQEMWAKAAPDLIAGNGRRLENIRSWLMRIAMNCVIDHSRRRKAEMAALRGLFLIVDHTFPDSAEAASDRERSELLERALDRLGDQERKIVTAKFAEGLSSSEIAEELGIPASTVRGKQQRTLARVKALIGHGCDAPC